MSNGSTSDTEPTNILHLKQEEKKEYVKPELQTLTNKIVSEPSSIIKNETSSIQSLSEESSNVMNQGLSIDDLNASKVIGGAPVRQWINSEITPTLLKGMKIISVTQPEQPLKVLAEFLISENEKLNEKKLLKERETYTMGEQRINE